MKNSPSSSVCNSIATLILFIFFGFGCNSKGNLSPHSTNEKPKEFIQNTNGTAPEDLEATEEQEQDQVTHLAQNTDETQATSNKNLTPTNQGLPWSSMRGGQTNPGKSETLVRTLHKLGPNRPVSEFDTGGLVWATPVIDEFGNTYIGAANKHFYSFTPDGRKRWEYKIGSKADSLIDSAAALAPGLPPGPPLVIIPGGDGALHALNRNTGEKVWKYEAHGASDATHQSGVIVNSFEGNVQFGTVGKKGLIYAGSDNGHMYAVDQTGNLKWSKKTGMMIWTSAVFSNDQMWMAFGSLDGKLYLVDPQTGEELAAPHNCKSDIKSSPTVDNKGNIYFGTSNGDLVSLMVIPNNGKKKYTFKQNWSFHTDREIYSSPTYVDGKVVFGSVDGSLYAVNATNGTLEWRFNAYSKILSSPLVTQDKVVLFGAKNGKIYAINLIKGDRIWSYKTTLNPIKSNLDSSPALDKSGVIHVGSYNGKIYHIPYEYCLTHKADSERCEFGGKQDSPEFTYTKDRSNLSTLVWIPSQLNQPFDSSSPLQLRLIVLENYEFVENAAIDALKDELHVEITPKVEFRTQVSSDGKYLNIIPKGFFSPGTEYKIKVKGLYYKQSNNFIADRLNPVNWIGNQPFESELSFSTKPATGNPFTGSGPDDTISWGLNSFYLLQPEALDTYTPAALDGQGFMVTAFGFNSTLQKMLMIAVPAIPEHEGVEDHFTLLPEPSKVFALEGFYQKDNIKGNGSLKLAAMGGEMPLDPLVFSAAVQPKTGNLAGQLSASTFCLSIKGNGSKYSFPFSLANQVCDPFGYLNTIGIFKGIRMNDAPPAAKVLHIKSGNKNEITVELQATGMEGPHLLSVVQYNPRSVTVVHLASEVVKPNSSTQEQTWSTKFKLKEKCTTCCPKGSEFPIAVFLDSTRLNLSDVTECAENKTEPEQKRNKE